MAYRINLIGYVILKGAIRCLTGIHIGGSAEAIDKGGIDSPVIKNPVTNEPYIPGSSLRGRMRSILEKSKGLPLDELSKDKIFLHHILEPDTSSHSDNSLSICKTFGGFTSRFRNGRKEKDKPIPAALIVRDCLLYNRDEYMDGKLPITEAKMETAIDRITSAAQPRTIERVPAGAEFSFEIIYRVQSDKNGIFTNTDNEFVKNNIENILKALEIIEKHDGLGGHSARGYGQVKFIVTGLDTIKIDSTPAFVSGVTAFSLTEVTEDSFTDYESLNSQYVEKISFPELTNERTEGTAGTEKEG